MSLSKTQYPAQGQPATVSRWSRLESIAAARRGDITRLVALWRRDGVLPHSPADLARLAANALIFKFRQDIRVAHVVDLCDGMVSEAESRRAVSRCDRLYHERGPRYGLIGSREAGQMLWLDREDRRAARVRTMEAIDENRAERKAYQADRKREMDRQRQRRIRAAGGAKPREASVTALKPWEVEGISRRTWYRRQAVEVGTDSSPTVLGLKIGDESVPRVPVSRPVRAHG